jgi:hypothetical protein
VRQSLLIVWVCIAAPPFACLGCVRREDNGPLLRRLAEESVGEYQLSRTDTTMGGVVYDLPEGANETQGIPWTKPRLILEEDRSFRFESFPPQWLPALTRPGDKSLDGSGQWRIDSDPESGVFEHLEVDTVNCRQVAMRLSFWLGALRLEDQNGKKIAVFVRARPEGEREK